MNKKMTDKKRKELSKEKREVEKRMLKTEYIIMISALIHLFECLFFAAYFPMENTLKVILCLFGFVLFFIGVFYCLKIEQSTGYYKCRHCGYKYIPSYRAVTIAPHYFRTRYMKCPKCKKNSWQHKTLN